MTAASQPVGQRTCSLKANTQRCPCTYEPCERKGICCQCIAYHRRNREVPACFFPPEVEGTYDRSLRRFISSYR